MGCCDSRCVLKALSVLSGLAAAAILAVSLLISTWVRVFDLRTTSTPTQQPDELFNEDMLSSSGDVGSGLVSEDVDVQSHGISILVGLWKVCVLNSANTGVAAVPPCWVTSPFDTRLEPPHLPQPVMHETFEVLSLIKQYHFHLPLLVSLGLIVIALLVTSGGMARNNMIVLVGSGLYEFAALVMAVSIMWFLHVVRQAETPEFQYRLDTGVYYAGLAFLSIHMAAALAIATYHQKRRKARRRVTRKLSKRDIVLVGQTSTNSLRRF